MLVNFDLLALPGAEYCERDGVRGVFVPEVPNFEYFPATRTGKKSTPSRAVIRSRQIRARGAAYDYCGAPFIPRKYYDAYLANPNYVNRHARCVFVYNSKRHTAEPSSVSTPEDFERMLGE